jgi:hypothetical protein
MQCNACIERNAGKTSRGDPFQLSFELQKFGRLLIGDQTDMVAEQRASGLLERMTVLENSFNSPQSREHKQLFRREEIRIVPHRMEWSIRISEKNERLGAGPTGTNALGPRAALTPLAVGR